MSSSVSTTTSAFYERSSLDLNSLRAQMEQVQTQISSGNRLAASSDDPLTASRLRNLQRQDAIAKVDAGSANRATADLNLTDSAMTEMINTLQRTRELANQAATGTLSDQQRTSIGNELAELRNNLVSLANTRDSAGNALFGGDASANAYTVDPVTGAVGYVGSGSAGSLELGDGQSVKRQEQVAFETVVLGSLVSAGIGHLEGRGAGRREHLDATFDNVRIDRVEVSARGATYRGAVFNDERQSLPLTLTATRVQQRVQLQVTVPGADLVVLHAARQPLTVGIPPRFPARNLRERVWWAAPQTAADQPAFTTLLGYAVGIDAPYPTALDLRQVRRNEIHVWGPTLRLSIHQDHASP
jgi:flagellin-like hook-associated protein FlgL